MYYVDYETVRTLNIFLKGLSIMQIHGTTYKRIVTEYHNSIRSELIVLLAKKVFTLNLEKAKPIAIFADGTPELVKERVNGLLESYVLVDTEYQKLGK